MKKLCCMIALAAISFGSVYAAPVIGSTMKTDTTIKKDTTMKMKKKKWKMKSDTGKMKMKMKKDTTKV